MTEEQAKKEFRDLQLDNATSPPIMIVIAKRRSTQTLTCIQQDWATFDQMQIVPYHVVDTDAIIPLDIRPNTLPNLPYTSTHGEKNNNQEDILLITPSSASVTISSTPEKEVQNDNEILNPPSPSTVPLQKIPEVNQENTLSPKQDTSTHTSIAIQKSAIDKDTRAKEIRYELKNQTQRQSTRKKSKSI